MSKFVTGSELEKVVYDIIWEAQDALLIVSPYIRLDDYFKTLFEKHRNNHKLRITIVFGKNENDVSKSLSKSDFDFFKNFMNVSILYVQNLHGKYYGNESKGVITSINLYDSSFKGNIEFGVFSEFSGLTKFTGSLDEKAWQACWQIAESGEAVFIKRPVFEKKMLSALLGKNYIKSDILLDETESFYSWNRRKSTGKKLLDFPDELELGSKSEGARPSREEVSQGMNGFCIRTGVPIPFNPDRPFSDNAYRTWSQFGDPNYPEKYCHFSGEPSNGDTSKNRPILRKNWNEANRKHHFF